MDCSTTTRIALRPLNAYCQHINKVDLVGDIEWEPEIIYDQYGVPTCSFILRTNITKNGEQQFCWILVKVKGDMAEYYWIEIKSGSLIKVHGFINASVYYDTSNKPHLESFVEAEDVIIL